MLQLNPLQTGTPLRPIIDEAQRQEIRAEYEAWRSHLDTSLLPSTTTDKSIKAAGLSLIVANHILLPSGEIDLNRLHQIQLELSGGDWAESSVAETLRLIASSQPFQNRLTQAKALCCDEEQAIVNGTLHRPLSHPIKDEDVRLTLLANFLVPVDDLDPPGQAWEGRGACPEQIIDDFLSLIQNDYVERTIQGQKYQFFGGMENGFLEGLYSNVSGPGDASPLVALAPLVNQWINATTTMRFLPSHLTVNRPDWRIDFFTKILTAFHEAAIRLKRDDVAKLYGSDFVRLTSLHDQEGDRLTIQEKGIESLRKFSLYGESRYWPSLCIHTDHGIAICRTVEDFSTNAKKIFLEACGAVDQLAWKNGSDGTPSAERQLTDALSKIYNSISPDDSLGTKDLIIPIALGQLAQEDIVAHTLPRDLHHMSIWARWIQASTPNPRIPSNIGMLLPQERSLLEGTDLLKRKKEALFRALDQDPSRTEKFILKPFQEKLFEILKKRRKTSDTLVSTHFIVELMAKKNTSAIDRILESIETAQEMSSILFTDVEISSLQTTLLNACYMLHPKETEATLVKYASTTGGDLYFWANPLGRECSFVYQQRSSSFSVAEEKSLSWFSTSKNQLPEEIQKGQKILRELTQRGFEGPSITFLDPQPAPQPAQTNGRNSLQAPIPANSPALREEALRRYVGDLDSPFESIETAFHKKLSEKLTAWNAEAHSLEDYSIPPVLAHIHSFPYLLAEAIVLPDGSYNWEVIDDVIRELIPPPEARDDGDIEIIQSLSKLQQRPELRKALEEISVPTLRTPSAVIRNALGLPPSHPITIRDVRLVCFASYLTCMRQDFAPDCALFSNISYIKDNYPEEMLAHWKDLMSTGAVQGKITEIEEEEVEQFRWIDSEILVSEEKIPEIVETRLVKKFLANRGETSENFKEILLQRIRLTGSLSMKEILIQAGASENLLKKIKSSTTSPLLEMWEFTLAAAKFPPLALSSMYFSSLEQRTWAMSILTGCYTEASRRGFQKLSEKIISAIQSLKQESTINDPDFKCLNTIRHSLLFKEGGFFWSPYMERNGDFERIDANDTQAFEKVFVQLCQSVYGPEALSMIAQAATPFPTYAEACGIKRVGNKLDVSVPAMVRMGALSFSTLMATHHILKVRPSLLQEHTLRLTEEGNLPGIFKAHQPTDSQRGSIAHCHTMGEDGHAFRILSSYADLSDKRIESTKKKTIELWNTVIQPSAHVTQATVSTIKKIVEIRFQNRPDLLQDIDKAVAAQLANASTRLRTGLLKILSRIEVIVERRFNDRERQCLELAAFRGMTLDHPKELTAITIPFADTNWTNERTFKVQKGLYSFYFSPLSRSWRIALVEGDTVSEEFRLTPREAILLGQ